MGVKKTRGTVFWGSLTSASSEFEFNYQCIQTRGTIFRSPCTSEFEFSPPVLSISIDMKLLAANPTLAPDQQLETSLLTQNLTLKP